MVLGETTVRSLERFFGHSISEQDILKILDNYYLISERPFILKKKSSLKGKYYLGLTPFSFRYFYVRAALTTDSPVPNKILQLRATRALLEFNYRYISTSHSGMFDVYPGLFKRLVTRYPDSIRLEVIGDEYYRLHNIDENFDLIEYEREWAEARPHDIYTHSIDSVPEITSTPDWSQLDIDDE